VVVLHLRLLLAPKLLLWLSLSPIVEKNKEHLVGIPPGTKKRRVMEEKRRTGSRGWNDFRSENWRR